MMQLLSAYLLLLMVSMSCRASQLKETTRSVILTENSRDGLVELSALESWQQNGDSDDSEIDYCLKIHSMLNISHGEIVSNQVRLSKLLANWSSQSQENHDPFPMLGWRSIPGCTKQVSELGLVTPPGQTKLVVNLEEQAKSFQVAEIRVLVNGRREFIVDASTVQWPLSLSIPGTQTALEVRVAYRTTRNPEPAEKIWAWNNLGDFRPNAEKEAVLEYHVNLRAVERALSPRESRFNIRLVQGDFKDCCGKYSPQPFTAPRYSLALSVGHPQDFPVWHEAFQGSRVDFVNSRLNQKGSE